MESISEGPVSTEAAGSPWHQSACILCECNCGVEIRLGSDGRSFERIRGDKARPASKGYTCEKALRLDYYQNGRGERLLSPLRRRPDGTYEEIDWDTAIREVAGKLAAVRDTYGGETIVAYGGGGQGNHLCGVYGSATLGALGSRFKASAISQEKTGEMLVMGKMFGVPLRGDFEHCEVAFFIGKNPWIPHGIPHARTTLKAIAADPDRALIVIDPRVSETAAMADYHLRVRPGRDAWLVTAMAAVLVDEGLVDRAWLDDHAVDDEDTLTALGQVPISRFCEIAGVDEALVRAATRRIAAASSVAAFEDLGVQMNRHSTLVSYVEKLVWLLTEPRDPRRPVRDDRPRGHPADHLVGIWFDAAASGHSPRRHPPPRRGAGTPAERDRGDAAGVLTGDDGAHRRGRCRAARLPDPGRRPRVAQLRGRQPGSRGLRRRRPGDPRARAQPPCRIRCRHPPLRRFRPGADDAARRPRGVAGAHSHVPARSRPGRDVGRRPGPRTAHVPVLLP